MTQTTRRSIRRYFVAGFVIASLICVGGLMAAALPQTPNELVVHEWGTFTSVAGADGEAIQWRPLSGPSDLPCFVRGLPGNVKAALPLDFSSGNPLSSASLGALAATVRMETPVLYFYSAQETRVDVGVQFPQGLITEWYPNAAVQPAVVPTTVAGSTGAIAWSSVKVSPAAQPKFLTEPGQSHYYAARGTDAAPVQVNGQTEKFLFYRGLGGFRVPVTAVMDRDRFVVNSPAEGLSAVVLFENRGGRIGYRIANDVHGRVTLDAPALTSNVDALGWDLERMLTAQGLYPREAKAMVATWRDSWFEEGARVFYLLSQSTVDGLLPLTISPRPAQVARAFVGRLEVITPAMQEDVTVAFRKNDLATLNKYGRFLEPITWRVLANPQSSLDQSRVSAILRTIAASHVSEASCR